MSEKKKTPSGAVLQAIRSKAITALEEAKAAEREGVTCSHTEAKDVCARVMRTQTRLQQAMKGR